MYKLILLVFPHQLFENHPGFDLDPRAVVLIEDSLFFGDDEYPACFHKQKLWLHRASMKRYQKFLQGKGLKTEYLEYDAKSSSLKGQLKKLFSGNKKNPAKFALCEPTDFILTKRLKKYCRQLHVELEFLPSAGFLNQPQENSKYRAGKTRWFMADFYKWQRQRLKILLDGDQPLGGKWSFDNENRKKVPNKLLGNLPTIPAVEMDSIDLRAKQHVEEQFPDHPGSLDNLYYPTSHQAASQWLDHFLENRFAQFGDYEDAIVQGQSWLWHSVLTPALNIGLLTPQQIIDRTLDFANEHDIPINSRKALFDKSLAGANS